jgi:WD40 repeat protein
VSRKTLCLGVLILLISGQISFGQELPPLLPITVENAADLQVVAALGGDQIYDLAWSLDGKYLAAGSSGNTYLYDTTDFEASPQHFLSAGEKIQHVAFSADGQWLTTSGAKLRIYDIENSQLLATQEGGGLYLGGAFAYRSDLLAFDLGGTVGLFQLDQSPSTNELQGLTYSQYIESSGSIGGILFSPDEKQLAVLPGYFGNEIYFSNTSDYAITLWDMESILSNPMVWDIESAASAGAVMRLVGHEAEVHSAAFDPSGTKLISAGIDGTFHLWDLATGSELGVLDAHAGAVWDIVFSPDGSQLVSVGWDGKLRFWDAQTMALLNTYAGYHTALTALAFSPDGTQLAIGSWDGRIWLLDVKSGEQRLIRESSLAEIWDVEFSPDGSLLAAATDHNEIWIWDIKTGEPFQILRGHSGPVYSIDFNSDGTLLASGSSDRTVRLWDVQTGQETANYTGHRGAIYGLDISPDGTLIASAGWDHTARVWDISSGEQKLHLEDNQPVYDVAFSPDQQLLFYGALHAWDLLSEQETAFTEILLGWSDSYRSDLNRILFGPIAGRQYSRGEGITLEDGSFVTVYRDLLAFSPDYQLALTWRGLIDLQSEEQLAHVDFGRDAAFNSNGTLLATGGTSGQVVFWGVLD